MTTLSALRSRLAATLGSRLDWQRWDRPFLVGNLIAVVLAFGVMWVRGNGFGWDAQALWQVDPLHPYGSPDYGTPGAFFYSPAVALVVAPFGVLPFPVLVGLLLAVELTALGWLVGWRWLGYALLLPPVMDDMLGTNINLALTAAIVLGLQRPALWSFVILTKVTPGIGVLWFAGRREWRRLAVAIGVTAVIALISFAVAPDAWRQWIAILADNAGRPASELAFPIPFVVRLPIAAALVLFAGRTGRAWLVPVGAFLAVAVIWREHDVLLLGAIAAWRRSRSQP